jgi:peptidoglycan/LPS O-acetylase OafA/YrhL
VVLCVASLAAGPFIRLALVRMGLPPLAAYEFSIARWDALSAGALLAVLASDDAGRRHLARAVPWFVALALAGVAVVLAVARTFDPTDPVVAVVGQTAVALLALALVRAAARSEPTLGRDAGAGGRWGDAAAGAMRARWLRVLGKYSYGIYVFHLPIHTFALWYLTRVIGGGAGALHVARFVAYVVAAGGLSVAAAAISWHLLERPLLDLKDRFAPVGAPQFAPTA